MRPIGRVESPLSTRAEAPKREDEDAPPARLVIDERFVDGLDGLRVGDMAVVVTWLHLSNRELLTVRPRGDPKNPFTGVFQTRSPDRPNPIGLHTVEITSVDAGTVGVAHLEALDGTPVIDLKPVRRPRRAG
ncbi:MAG: tRNA (N6-threonylcarbamoyladenosine(37)-N6)-methyltransferase TrmO [Actinomycetia bacterium]|nr:tRNA (N6-threonylcarbamoyladenosine(37)-N6)-methyltransferase TrmO [Actinomycetes bacterium]